MRFLFLSLLISLSTAAKVQLNPTIITFGVTELRALNDNIAKASFNRNHTINIIPTIYVSVDKQHRVTAYYYKDEHGSMKPMTKEFINTFGYHMAMANFLTSKLGITVYITPHLDDVNNKIWRHHFKFDPLKKYNGFSYYDIFIYPIKMIFKRAKSPVYFTLFGEMGKSLRGSWKSYTDIIKDLPKNIKAGVSFNFNDILGESTPTIEKHQKAFFRKLDFIGFSNYMSVSSQCTKNDFHKHIRDFRRTLSFYGVSKNIPLHFNEVGIGGGAHANDLKTIAATAEEAAKYPYSGLKKQNPWSIPELNEMRYRYYQCLMDFLKDDKITAAFNWSLESWDMTGYHPTSKSFIDSKLNNKIKNFNLSR